MNREILIQWNNIQILIQWWNNIQILIKWVCLDIVYRVSWVW